MLMTLLFSVHDKSMLNNLKVFVAGFEVILGAKIIQVSWLV